MAGRGWKLFLVYHKVLIWGLFPLTYLNDLFFIELKLGLCNFADDNTLYAYDMSLDALVAKLETSAEAVIKWFEDNCMKLNESKCKLLVSSKQRGNNSISWTIANY